MSTRYRLPGLFLGLVALLLITACSHDSGDSDSGSGNVRVMFTSGSASTATSSADSVIAASSLVGTAGSVTPLHGDDDDDDDDGDDGGDDDLLSRLAQVNVTFSSLLARNLDGDLVDLAVDLPRTVDLIGLMNGRQITLPTGTLPPGMYDQIVVVIRSVEFVFLDGRKELLTPPGGGWTRIVPVTTFEVIDGQTTTIELRFKPSGALRERNGGFEFSPDFDCRTDR